jgi:uncharacterized protein
MSGRRLDVDPETRGLGRAVVSGVIVEFDVPVRMSDGQTLGTDVYRPADDEPHPCLLQRVPYDKSQPVVLNGALDVMRAVRRGYAVVTQDCRGRFSSSGIFEPFLHEGQDGVETIDWVASQSWSDGNVGMFGRSYSGFLQWHTAARRPAALKAIAPTMCGVDVVDGWFSGNVLEWGLMALWACRYLAPNYLARDGWPLEPATATEIWDAPHLLLAERSDRLAAMIEVLPFLRDWLDTGDGNAQAFAALKDASEQPIAGSIPSLVIAGWYDIFLPWSLRSYRDMTAGTDKDAACLIVGPWPHGGGYSGVFPEKDAGISASSDAVGLTDLQLNFFDRWLRDGAGGPQVRYFVTGINTWRTSTSWPPPTMIKQLYLAAQDEPRLVPVAPNDPGISRFAFDENDPLPTRGGQTFLPGMEVAANAGPRDQRPLLDRKDLVYFVGQPLNAPLEVTGSPELELFVDVPFDDTSIVVRFIEVEPSSAVMLLSEGAHRVPVSGHPDEPVLVSLPPVAHVFPAGSRLGVIISTASHPRFRRWVTPTPPAEPRKATVQIHLGGARASRLKFPVAAQR